MTAETTEITHYFLKQVSHFEPLLLHYGVLIIMAAVAVEGFGIPAPGQTLLVVGAVLAARGKFNIDELLAGAWFASVVGSLVGYYVGRLGGRRLLARLPVNQSHLERMERLCAHHGGKLILVARFIDGPRQLSSFLVGVLQMSPARFLVMTSVGAVLWVGVWGMGAYQLDRHIHVLDTTVRHLSPYAWAATLLAVLLLVIYLFRRNHNRKRDQ